MSAWQPIETAPKDGSVVLLASQDKEYVYAYYPVVARWCGERDAWFNFWSTLQTFTVKHGPPTHWMPLPDPPT